MFEVKESYYDQSVRVKGYGSSDADKDYFSDICKFNTDFRLDYFKKAEMESEKKTEDGRKVKPIVIEDVQSFIKEIDSLNYSDLNPLFYRGHTNANMLMCPSILRDGNVVVERQLMDSFLLRFPQEFSFCKSTMSKIVLMRHYGLNVRALDITEDPLVALYFACSEMKKFNHKYGKDSFHWGEVVIVKESDDLDGEILLADKIKYESSKTVSIIANTACMKKQFSLQELVMAFKNDGFLTLDGKYLQLKDIICRSIIIRTSKNNPRIKNQSGAFIMVNANKLNRITKNGNYNSLASISSDELMNFLLAEDIYDCNFECIQKKFFMRLFHSGLEDFYFEKINPFDKKNAYDKYKYDPFDLNRLLYKDSENKQIVFLIPPTAKKRISLQLEKLGYTEDFVYPDMDCVANELNERMNSKSNKK